MTETGKQHAEPAADGLPSWTELAAGERTSQAGTCWGVFGDDDEIGTLNLVGRDQALHGLAAVRDGATFSLNWDVDQPDCNPWRPRPRVVARTPHPDSRDDDLVDFALQYSSQWDGLRHIRGPHGFYNGRSAPEIDAAGSTVLGIQHWSRRGITGHGVLLDAARYLAAKGPYQPDQATAITPGDLEAIAGAQSSRIECGDILLVRTGWAGWYARQPADVRASAISERGQAGLAATEEVVAWLWEHRVAAVAADNSTVEVWPGGPLVEWPLHTMAIAGFGYAFGEHFWLDDLADACAADGRWAFLFVAAPLNVPGGAGSPANALAIR